MHKGLGAKAQVKGDKRNAKVAARKRKKKLNTAYLVKLMFKYGINLKLKSIPVAGEKYLKGYLND
jgi:hypothetical protein